MSKPTPDRGAPASESQSESQLESRSRSEAEPERLSREALLSRIEVLEAREEKSAHLRLMFDAAAELFTTPEVAPAVESVYQRLSTLIGLDGYFHYRTLDRAPGRMELAGYGGVDAETAERIRHLRLAEVVCGAAVRDRAPAVVTDVQGSTDPKTRFIRSLGVTAYACFPLMSTSDVFGTFSFFRRGTERYTSDELALLRSVCDLCGIAWERNRAERALTREREFLERLIDTIPVMITVYDPKVREVRVNREFERVLGWSNQDLKRLDVMEACYPDPAYRERVRSFMQSLEDGWRDFRVTAKDGTVVESTWANIRLADATQVGIGIDIADRKRAEAALREAKRAAERASEAKSQFLSTMSHELRTPLTAVVGLSDLMEAEVAGPLNQEQKDVLSRIRGSAQHLVSIIDEILTFSRSEAGKEEVRLTRVDVAAIARGVVGMLAGDADEKGLALRLDGADGRVAMLTDGGKVRQIVTNLVGNALKYTDAGAVEVELATDPSVVVLRIRDTGPGIPPDRLDDIFEPFVQVDGSITRRKGGTGLGLTICRRLARLLDGDVTVESTLGEGSTFALRLPRG